MPSSKIPMGCPLSLDACTAGEGKRYVSDPAMATSFTPLDVLHTRKEGGRSC